MTTTQRSEPWRRRLFIPNYQVGEAARYAGVDPQTVAAWHGGTLPAKEDRAALSYMQLIEVAVVAAARKAGVQLKEIRAAREWVSKQLHSEFPFAEYRFKTDGKDLLLDFQQVEGGKPNTLVVANQGGQLAWSKIIGRLREFEYEDRGIAIRWKVAGTNSPIVIDPRLSFGAPTVGGIATWAIKGRYQAGETDAEIADDFDLDVQDVRRALKFEGLLGAARSRATIH